VETMAAAACLAGALTYFMWVLTRHDRSSAYWAAEMKKDAARTASAAALNREHPIMRSVSQYFPAICLTCILVVPALAEQRQWTPDRLDSSHPFGDIAVETAKRSQREFHIFFENLSDQERAEMRARCGVIGSDRRFARWVRDLCRQVEQSQDGTERQSKQALWS
jgi:hypothetical protein